MRWPARWAIYVNGLGASQLPPWSLGYLYLPALLGVVGCSVLTAPLGARLAHSLPVPHLKRVFALLLFVMGTKMLYDLLRQGKLLASLTQILGN